MTLLLFTLYYLLIYLTSGLWIQMVDGDEIVPTNGVDGEQRLLSKLRSSIPSMWPPVDMVNRTVFIYVDLFKIQEIRERVSNRR